MGTIEIRYFLDGVEYAGRSRRWVPRVGDEVKFKQLVYVVKRVVWIENGMPAHVAIDIEST